MTMVFSTAKQQRCAALIVLWSFLVACQSSPMHSANGKGQIARAQYLELRRLCIEHHGGLAMDAADLYAGRLSVACSRWAHRHAPRLPD